MAFSDTTDVKLVSKYNGQYNNVMQWYYLKLSLSPNTMVSVIMAFSDITEIKLVSKYNDQYNKIKLVSK